MKNTARRKSSKRSTDEPGLAKTAGQVIDNASKAPLKGVNSEMLRVLRELEIYKVELEMQNEELISSRDDLERSRNRFVNLFELAPIAYLRLDQHGMILQGNNAAVKLIGDGKSLGKKRMYRYVHHEDGDLFYRFLQNLRMNPVPQVSNLRMVSEGKRNMQVGLYGVCVSGRPGEPVEFYVSVSDLTEQKEAEAALIKMKDQLEMSLQSSFTGTWSIDLATRIISWDRFVYPMFGLTQGQFDGTYNTFLTFVHPEDRSLVDRKLMSSIVQKREIFLEYDVVWPD